MASTLAPARARPALVRVVVCGSVDDGKSTLIGRLLAETDSVPLDHLDYARRHRRGGSTIPVGEIDFSLLTDGLEAEQAQGITIDVAYRHLYLPSGRRAVLADAPGHEQYTRNMAVAASIADMAVLLVDAERGVRPQTFRHLTVCSLMGVRSALLAVNKMDAAGYARERFDEQVAQVRAVAGRLGVDEVLAVPVSALRGDNVTSPSAAMPWYSGPTLLELLSGHVPPATAPTLSELRLPVQYVVRAPGLRGYAGTIAAGELRPGDRVRAAGSGVVSTVDRLLRHGTAVPAAAAGTPVVVTLTDEVDLTRGDLLVPGDATPQPSSAYTAELVWVGDEPLRHGRSYLLLCGGRSVPAVVTTVRHSLDVVTGEHVAARILAMNDVGMVEVVTEKPVALDAYHECRDTGGFLLADRLSRDTVAAGLVVHPLRRGTNVVPHDYAVNRAARARLKRQQPRVLWLTGLPGSGKSTIADALERRLYEMGLHTYVLDGDNVRTGLNKDLGFTPEDRAENVRRVAETARLLFDAGLIVIVALVSPFRADRRSARRLFGPGEFLEVWIDTPPEVCAQRDPKGLYAKARAGELPNMTGMGQSYEPPEEPEEVVAGTGPVDEAVERLVHLLE